MDQEVPLSQPSFIDPGAREANRPLDRVWPVLSLLFAATFWGFIWYPLRALDQAGIAGLWQLSVSFGSALLLFLIAARPSLEGVSRSAGGLLVLALASGWTNIAFALAMIDGSVMRVLILFYLSPVWATLLGRLILGERIGTFALFVVPIGLVGGTLMLWGPQVGWLWPLAEVDWLALSSGITFALANVMARRMSGVGVAQKSVASWSGVVLLALTAIVLLELPLPGTVPAAWGGAVLLGVFGFIGATLAALYGVSRLPIQRASVIMLFEIPVGGLSAWLIAGESLLWREWLGGILIVTAGLIAVWSHTDE